MSFLERTEEIWEYCRENWMLLAAAGLVILILLLSVWLVRLSRRDRQEPEDVTAEEKTPAEEILPEAAPADESAEENPGEGSAETETAAEEAEETGTIDDEGNRDPADGFDTTQAYELLNLLKSLNESVKKTEEEISSASEISADEVQKAEPEEDIPLPEPEMQPEMRKEAEEELPEIEEPRGAGEAETAAVQGLAEHLMQKVEETSSAAGQKVASIELKIEKAQLTIHYADDEKKRKAGLPAAGAQEKKAESADFAGEDTAGAEEERIPKKFGMDNRNRARSGRLFTEEELRVQIRE